MYIRARRLLRRSTYNVCCFSIIAVVMIVTVMWSYCQTNIQTNLQNPTWVSSLQGFSKLFFMKNKTIVKDTRQTVVIGILSHAKRLCRREAQRKLFIPKARSYKMLVIKVFFLIDYATPELEEEQRIHQDIVFLNTTITGYSVHYAMKIHMWLTYATKTFPEAALIGRMDDDVFACVPQVFDRLNVVKDELLYYGYSTGTVRQCPTQDCLDDMFLFVGVTLARRMAKRSFCQDRMEKNCLEEEAEGIPPGNMFRRWLKIYDDLVHINERNNGRMIWFYRGTTDIQQYTKYKTINFCNNFLLYHTATISDLYEMHQNNSLLVNDPTWTNITGKDIEKAIHCSKYTKKT